ncbi:hypothetical protein [Pelosinus propionicus]|uniref:Uncharacterized protein n=1 Tax=Pelosinus propionicus DSM 13327 TaxID=1123291 RepID=A0A1I4QCA0_9FIRM|nr:hypothetical protein [Pelosinus propionicus]SFM37698.1 hypothetical protein SAMN04490355_10949 [Pelosinus propionicus DSM 13327]
MSDMIELKKHGVHRIVATEQEAKKLISEGYVQLDAEGNPITAESETIESLKAQIELLTTENAALKAAKK